MMTIIQHFFPNRIGLRIILKVNFAQFYFLSGNECIEAVQTFPFGKIIKSENVEFYFSYMYGTFLPQEGLSSI